MKLVLEGLGRKIITGDKGNYGITARHVCRNEERLVVVKFIPDLVAI